MINGYALGVIVALSSLAVTTSVAQNAPGGINQTGPNAQGTVINNNFGDRPDLGNVCYTQFGGYPAPYLGIGASCSANINGRTYPGFIGEAGHHPHMLPMPQ